MILNSEKYKQRFFKDMDLQEAIREQGYIKIPLLDSVSVRALRRDARELLGKIPVRQKIWKYISAGRIADPEIRKFSNKSIEKHVVPRLRPLFHDNIDLIPGVHLIKPPSPASMLNAHQDSALVNERRYLSVYAWVPLVDTNKRNGTLHVIPRSHHLELYQRSLNVPWELEPFMKSLNKYLIPVKAKAGEVVFFDSALVHGSPNNLSLSTRIAVNVFLKPREADYLHYYMEDMDGDEVEVYKVSPEFFIEHDISKRPSRPFELLRLEKRQLLHLTEEKVIAAIT